MLSVMACQSTNKFHVEDELYSCYVNYFQEKDLNLNYTIKKTEQILKDHEIIGGTSGEEIIKTITWIKEENDIPFKISSSLIDSLAYLRDINLNFNSDFLSGCSITSSSFQKSRLNNLIEIFDELERKDDISIQVFLTEVLEVYNAEDFENRYYRMLFLLGMGKFILFYHDAQEGLML